MQLRHYGQNLALWRWKMVLGIDQIPAELIRPGGETLCSEVHKLTPSVWNDEFSQQWRNCFVVPISRKGGKTECNNYRGIFIYQLTTTFYPTFFWPGYPPKSLNILGIVNIGSVVTDLLQMRFSTFGIYWTKNGIIVGRCISYS
jgi:hypothetical protein